MCVCSTFVYAFTRTCRVRVQLPSAWLTRLRARAHARAHTPRQVRALHARAGPGDAVYNMGFGAPTTLDEFIAACERITGEEAVVVQVSPGRALWRQSPAGETLVSQLLSCLC